MALKSENLQVAFTDSMTTHDSSYEIGFMHGKEALDIMVASVFSKMNEYLSSKGFTRVDANTIKLFPIDGQQYVLLCESYQLPNINQYLNVSMTLSTHSMYYASNYVGFNIDIIITDTLIQSAINGTTPNVDQQIHCEFPFTRNSSSEYDTEGNWKSTTDVITMNGNIIMRELTNDNILLFKGMQSQSNDLDKAIGFAKFGDDTYLAYVPSRDGGYNHGYIKFVKDDLVYYSQSYTIYNNGGTDTDGYIMTAPIFLTLAASQSSAVIKDLKLENALQTNYNGMCVYGAVYIIDDVEYLALHNNLLLRI